MSTTLFRNTIQEAFDRVSTEAIERGFLTPKERDTIRRRGTRKQFNHLRHLEDLCAYVEYKWEKGNHEHDTEREGNLATVD